MSKPWVTTKDYVGECRRTGNGDGHKLVWIIMTSACGVVFIGLMTWMTSLSGKLTSLEASTNSQALLTTGRMSAVEAVVQTVDTRLNRMESKLDMLIDRQNKGK